LVLLILYLGVFQWHVVHLLSVLNAVRASVSNICACCCAGGGEPAGDYRCWLGGAEGGVDAFYDRFTPPAGSLVAGYVTQTAGAFGRRCNGAAGRSG
jgi:hypothetical protein